MSDIVGRCAQDLECTDGHLGLSHRHVIMLECMTLEGHCQRHSQLDHGASHALVFAARQSQSLSQRAKSFGRCFCSSALGCKASPEGR